MQNKNVNNSFLPYYTCLDLRGRIVVSNAGNIIPCCTTYSALDNNNTNKLPIMNIDTMDVSDISEEIEKHYKQKRYKSVCNKCSSLRIKKSERKSGMLHGIKGEISGNFFFIEATK